MHLVNCHIASHARHESRRQFSVPLISSPNSGLEQCSLFWGQHANFCFSSGSRSARSLGSLQGRNRRWHPRHLWAACKVFPWETLSVLRPRLGDSYLFLSLGASSGTGPVLNMQRGFAFTLLSIGSTRTADVSDINTLPLQYLAPSKWGVQESKRIDKNWCHATCSTGGYLWYICGLF